MSEMLVTLTRAIFGMGNSNHDHVHRHTQLNLDSTEVDDLIMEQVNGGVTAGTLNRIAASSGNLSQRPQGYVSVEEGFGVRRGIGQLTFVIESNSNFHSEMCVVGYLFGGTASEEGISDDTMFVPVRTWSTLTTNTHDSQGFPMTKRMIDSSHQFLMGSVDQNKDLKAVRPLDVGNEALGFAASEEDGSEMMYSGTVGSDLKNNTLMSKTLNLNPTHYSRELLKLATNAGFHSSNGSSLEVELSNGLIGESIGELSPLENPFMRAMMQSTGQYMLGGFQGFSIGEIYQVFDNLLDVMNLNLLNPSSFAEDNTLLTSSEYGSAGNHEVIATELAMMSVHLMLQCGLSSLRFSATNNLMEYSTIMDDGVGVAFVTGEAMSMLDNDMFVENRVEDFKRLIAQHFFSKYSGPHVHLRTLMNIEVECYMFGEIVITIAFNGEDNEKTFTNATYYINHTSSSIAGNENGLLEAKNFLTGIREYFS
ncbi:hypothetical protein [Pseudomonas aeruginosa]|uniref:hypothetical protein n=1 Tax=Pseudomonas aeruginosa TaxID=287 RepID=UPI001BD4B646|nr:hypothetical protein [Pseudomonas aeruginosa]MBS9730388.1 hypothetical protein [Pseudomonas aeruginosa]